MEASTGPARRGIAATVVPVLVVLALLTAGPWVALSFYLDHFGIATDAEITDKREVIGLEDDQWHRDFMVSYRYRVLDGGATIDAAQPVDPERFQALRVGDRVRVHYSPWAPLRALGSAGATLEGTSWSERLPRGSNESRFLVEVVLCVVSAWLAYLAYTRKNWTIGLVAVVAGASVGAGIFLFGFLIFPLLLVAWWRNRGRGFGWALLASLVLSTLILAWRIPWPAKQPADPRANAVATVRQLHVVRKVWGTTRQVGQPLRRPYQLVDLEFTPQNSSAPVHALDAIDLDSLPGLAIGAKLPVVYALSDPHEARLSGGARTYARDLFADLMLYTFGTGAALLALGIPILRLLGKRSRRP